MNTQKPELLGLIRIPRNTIFKCPNCGFQTEDEDDFEHRTFNHTGPTSWGIVRCPKCKLELED